MTTRRTPYDLTVHLATPGCPVSYRESVQQVFSSADGAVTEDVGAPTLQGGEYHGDLITGIVGPALVAAQAQAAASEARATASDRRAADETARADAAERLAEDRLADAESVRAELGVAMETITQATEALRARTAALTEAQTEIVALRARLAAATPAPAPSTAPAADSVGPA